MKRPRTTPHLLAGAALLAILSGLAACQRSPDVGATPKPPAVTVVAATPRPVFVFMISGAKERAPAAAMALIERLSA